MVSFLTQIPDCDPDCPVLLDFIFFLNASICSTMVFPSLGNSDHIVVSVSIEFSVKFKIGYCVTSHSL